jgi:hypothetical protein
MKVVVLVSLATVAVSAVAQECKIEYQRADNMWAAAGRPDGQLGTETLTLKPGETKVFNTDWKYEKRRNDGTNYYGSHVRVLRNAGTLPVKLAMTGNNAQTGSAAAQVVGQKVLSQLEPGKGATSLRADLQEVSCPAGSKEAKAEDKKTPGGSANPPQQVVVAPPIGLAARQNPGGEIVLSWAPSPDAKEYRVYVDAPQPSPGGRPAIVGGGTGPGHFVIMVPRNVAPGTVYRASIEKVGTNSTISQRASFPPVQVQVAATGGGTGSGSPSGSGSSSTPATPASGDKRCPPGQFVTGISNSGALICAPR